MTFDVIDINIYSMEKEEKIKKTIASNLVYYRKLSNLKQIYVAEKINYSDKAISKWERGAGLPDIKLLEPLASALDLSLTELMTSKKNSETFRTCDAKTTFRTCGKRTEIYKCLRKGRNGRFCFEHRGR